MGEKVSSICSQAAVERAWRLYADKAIQIVGDPHLLVDRGFNEDLARLYDRWRRLFLFGDGEDR